MSEDESAEISTQELLFEMRRLHASAGWKYLAEVLRQQVDAREQQIILSPMSTTEEVNELRVLKAERGVYKLLLTIPETLIEELEMRVEEDEQTDSAE